MEAFLIRRCRRRLRCNDVSSCTVLNDEIVRVTDDGLVHNSVCVVPSSVVTVGGGRRQVIGVASAILWARRWLSVTRDIRPPSWKASCLVLVSIVVDREEVEEEGEDDDSVVVLHSDSMDAIFALALIKC